MKQISSKSKFDLIREMRGQYLTSRRSKWKTDFIFEFLCTKNLYLDTHEAINDTLKFWPLRGQISDIQEVIIQNWRHFWNLQPKKPIFRHPWCKNIKIQFWPPRGHQRSKYDLLEVIYMEYTENYLLWHFIVLHHLKYC